MGQLDRPSLKAAGPLTRPQTIRGRRPPGPGSNPRESRQLDDGQPNERHLTCAARFWRIPAVPHVRALGIDETSYLAATRAHRTIDATGLVDLDHRVLIGMVEGNSAADLRRWCAKQDAEWLEGIEVVATDLAEGYRAGTSPHLDHDGASS